MARIGLTLVPRLVAEYTGQPAPTYRRCFDAAVEARFPAMFANGRWTVDDADRDLIVAGLGLTVTKQVPAKPPRKASSAGVA